MLRNHVIDPESPAKLSINATNNPPSTDFDDPWYAGPSNENSPTNVGTGSTSGGSAMKPFSSSLSYGSGAFDGFEDEPPLLEELGVNLEHIISKTKAVVNPTGTLSAHILDDADLAGPIFFCLLLGVCLLLSGKIHFGYIYGFSVFGCLSMNVIINLMHREGLDFWRTCSVLGYSLIPVIGLAAVSILVDLRGTLGFILSVITIFWSTFSSTRIFHAKLVLTEQYWLVAYPVMLLYSCFVLITIF